MYLSAQLHRTAVGFAHRRRYLRRCGAGGAAGAARARAAAGATAVAARGRLAGGGLAAVRRAACCASAAARFRLGLRLLGVLPRLASRAQRALLRARVVPAAVLIVPATPECAFLYLKSRLSRRYLKATLELTPLRAGKPCFCDTKGTPRINCTSTTST